MDDDKFVARRGSQGDDWSWKGSRQAEPPAFPHSPEEGRARPGRSTSIADIGRRAAAWLAGVSSAAGDAIERLGAKPRSKPTKPADPEKPAYVPPPIETTAASTPPAVTVSSASRPRLRAPHMTMPHVSEDMRAPLVVFVALGLAVALAIFVAVLIAALDDGSADGGIVVDPSPTPTEPPSTPDKTATSTGTATAAPTASATPKPTVEPTPVPVPTSSAPQSGALALGLWANSRNEWWFSDLSSEVARYVEGQTLPFMVSWQAQPGALYSVQVTYDCATDDAFGAIDYLSGLQDFGPEPLVAANGPQATTPDGAIPVPETDLFTVDDGDSGVLFAYGGKFSLLPGPVQPPGDCDRRRSIQLPIQALADRVFLLGTLHLATDDVWGVDEGAASHDPPFGIQVVVSGVGQAGISIQTGTVLLGP